MSTEIESSDEMAILMEIRAEIAKHPRRSEVEAWARVLRSVFEAGEPARLALELIEAEEAAEAGVYCGGL